MPNTKNASAEKLLLKSQIFWDIADSKTVTAAYKLAEEYKNFLNTVKTEKQAVRSSVSLAEKMGYQKNDFDQIPSLKNNKLIFINRNKSVIFVALGSAGLTQGAKFLLAHVDSPHLDLKVKPLYEDSGIAYFKPHYYGGIKKYHWPAIPLSLHGTVVLKNEEELEINIGAKATDPVFLISDLLPHLDGDRLDKPLNKAIEAEELNIIVGTIPVKDKKIKNRVKMAVLQWLNKNFKMDEVDLFTADLRFVPTWEARDVGFDRSLIASYGQDDRACVFTTIKALLDVHNNERTKICYLVDKEEVGSIGATSAESLFLENVLTYLLKMTKTEFGLYDFMRSSSAISADTTGAFDPDYKQIYDLNNAVHLGRGVVIEKYVGHGGKYFTTEAEPKFIRELINLFNKKRINWQTGHLGKVDQGAGGGTIAGYFAKRNMEVVDIGPAMLNLHSPCELSSKADIYSTYQAYKAFLEN